MLPAKQDINPGIVIGDGRKTSYETSRHPSDPINRTANSFVEKVHLTRGYLNLRHSRIPLFSAVAMAPTKTKAQGHQLYSQRARIPIPKPTTTVPSIPAPAPHRAACEKKNAEEALSIANQKKGFPQTKRQKEDSP